MQPLCHWWVSETLWILTFSLVLRLRPPRVWVWGFLALYFVHQLSTIRNASKISNCQLQNVDLFWGFQMVQNRITYCMSHWRGACLWIRTEGFTSNNGQTQSPPIGHSFITDEADFHEVVSWPIHRCGCYSGHCPSVNGVCLSSISSLVLASTFRSNPHFLHKFSH